MKKLFLALILFISFNGNAQNLKGSITDFETGSGIPYAKIYCLETQNGATADSNGNWQLNNVINNQMTLQISAPEHESKMVRVDNVESDIVVKLEHAHIHLDEVIISTSDSKLQRYSTYPVDSRKISDLNKIEQTNLVDALSNMPGIYNQSTGNGISKPVIRGLSGMRVLTSQNGLRIENQQWGADHGFAIFNLGIDRVEVIKGPSSLIYGADALGGVIYIADEPYANAGESELSACTKFESNSMSTVNNVSYKTSKENLRFAVYGGYFSRADYGIPDNQFVTNSKNSGASIKTAIGYNKDNWITNFRYQLLYSQNGLPGHTHDSVWEASSFLSSKQSRTYNIPAQHIMNHLAQWENKFYFKKDELVAQLGFTSNELKEFEEKVTVPGIDMTLQNLSYNLRWKHQINKHFEIVSGSQGMMQSNTNGQNAQEILVANADFIDIGAFSLLKGTFDVWNFQAGARYDQRNIKTRGSINPLSKPFSGLNYSVGISRSSKNITTRLNASSGFRPPHISELLADGVHHATSQYLIGDDNLLSERANQIDFYFGMHFDHLEVVINPFVNQINNFIYNNPTGQNDSTSGLPIFDIKQTDELLSGGDIAIHYHPHIAHWLHLESNFSLLSTEDVSGNPLPQIPQNRLNNIVKIDFQSDKKLKINSLSAQYVYLFKQDNIVTYETTSDAYQLINIGCSGSYLSKHQIDFSFGVNNLLNTNYIDHLSRLKPYGLANPGRNIYVKLKLLISKS
ncbi:MAG: TonB-dependent receptor [Flavobacteriales bacterium]|nr:TonB-dependent receptor [Flavobacteriales bacterium]